jgi:hypothetical protein
VTAYEGSPKDRLRDKIGAKEKGVPMKAWERTMADHREDVLNNYDSYVAARQARKRGEPQRIPFHTEPKGPWMLPDKKGMNRLPHDPLKGTKR